MHYTSLVYIVKGRYKLPDVGASVAFSEPRFLMALDEGKQLAPGSILRHQTVQITGLKNSNENNEQSQKYSHHFANKSNNA